MAAAVSDLRERPASVLWNQRCRSSFRGRARVLVSGGSHTAGEPAGHESHVRYRKVTGFVVTGFCLYQSRKGISDETTSTCICFFSKKADTASKDKFLFAVGPTTTRSMKSQRPASRDIMGSVESV